MSNYRIAVCISGQSRTWRSTKDTFLEFFNFSDQLQNHQPITVDFFIHTWNINMFEDVHVVPRNIEQCTDIEDIKNFYNPKLMMVDNFYEKKDFYHWDALFYSFMKSVFLKKKWEIENDFVYDLVIKTRFDLIFNPSIKTFKLHDITPLFAYTSHPIFKFPRELSQNCFDDVMFYSDSFTMDIISNLVKVETKLRPLRQQNNFTNIDVSEYFGPGTLLYRHLIDNGIYPTTPKDEIHYLVYRKEAQDLNLDPVKDFYKIKEISDNWYLHLKNKI